MRACTASSLGPTKNRPLLWSAEEDAWGGALGWLLFVTVKPHSLGGGGGQHRGRWTGKWPLGLLLAEPPLRVAGHTCDGDKERVLTFLSLTTKMVQMATMTEMLVGAYKHHRWVHTYSNGTR
jgi:hypothetical protein